MNTAVLKQWKLVHIDLIGPYAIFIRQQQTCGDIINKDNILICTTKIDMATGWFEIFKFPWFGLDKVANRNT